MSAAKAGQLSLNIRTETEPAWMSCRGVFTFSYLRQHLAQSQHFPTAREAEKLYGVEGQGPFDEF
jgi:hypothetical protein